MKKTNSDDLVRAVILGASLPLFMFLGNYLGLGAILSGVMAGLFSAITFYIIDKFKNYGKPKDWKNIEGWLLIYFILNFLITYNFILSLGGSLLTGWYILSFTISLFVIFNFYNLIQSFRKKRESLRLNIFAIWFAFFAYNLTNILFLFDPFFVALTSDEKMDTYLVTAFLFLLSLIISFVWHFYWKKSKRVKNTFVK